MKRKILCLGLVLLFAMPAALRAQGKFGLGLIVGDPTGFSWKYRMGLNALDGAVGFSPVDNFRVHVDYLWVAHPFTEQHLSLTYAVGLAAGFGRTEEIETRNGDTFFSRDEPTGAGIRGPIGLNYMIPRSPVELTLELAPILIFSPDGGFGFDGGFAVRFYP